MASQLTIWRISSLSGAGMTGEVVRVYDPTMTTMKASTEGGEQGGGVLAIVDNGNGSYTVAAGLAYQTIAIAFNSTTAAETGYENIQWDGDDVHTHLDNLTKHRLISDSGTTTTVLLSASKIIATYLAKTDIDGTTVGLNGDGELEVKDSGIGNDKLGTAAVETINVKDANITVAKINYDTNDFEADGTKLSIKQSFSNETFINEDKSLNENLNNINNALVKHNTALNNTGNNLDAFHYNTIYNEDVAVASGVSGNEASFNYTEYNREDTAAGTSNIVIFQYIKQTGDLGIKVSFKYKYHTAGSEIELDTTDVGTCGWATPSGTQDVWTDTFIESTNRFEGASVGQELGFQLQLKSGPGQYIYVTRVKIDIISKNNSEI